MIRTTKQLEAFEDFSSISCEWDTVTGVHQKLTVAESDGKIWIPHYGSWIQVPDRHARTIAEFILEVLK